MEKLKKEILDLGLNVVEEKGKLKGNCCNQLSRPIFRAWLNKKGNLTIKTQGIQKSFENWDLKKVLIGFEIL